MTEPQTLVPEQPNPVSPTVSASSAAAIPAVEPCQECGAPMERQQRYCVECATRRPDVSNPASRYFAAASRQRRQNAASRTAEPAGGSANSTRAASVFFLALLPIAVAIGVVVGQSGGGASDEDLLAALSDGGGVGLAAAGAGESATVSDSAELLPSDFSLDEGFTVMIGSLPIESTDEAAADEATAAAEEDGAEDVGLINPGDFTTSPDQGQSAYLLYSGEFKSRGDAEKALGELKKSFPDAEVIEVEAAGAGGGSSASSGGGSDLNQNRVVAQTSHGEVHEVTAEPPSEEQVQRDTEIVNDIANQTGEDYTDLQESLPDVVVVGGDPADAPPLPTGAGD